MDLMYKFQRNFQTYSNFARLCEDKGPKKSITDTIPVRSPSRADRPPPPPPEPSGANVFTLPRSKVQTTMYDKRCLVWSGQFKKYADVPDVIDADTLHRARNWGRIRVNVVTIGICVVLCAGAIWWGKVNLDNRPSLTDEVMERHRKLKEMHDKEKEIAKNLENVNK